MIKSINAWAFDQPEVIAAHADKAEKALSIVRRAEVAATVGFEGIELTMGAEEQLTPQTSEPATRELGRQVSEAGLKIAALASGNGWRTPFSASTAAERENAVDFARAQIERAAWLGSDAILVVPAVVGTSSSPEPLCTYSDAYNATFEALVTLQDFASDHHVTIVIENVWNRFLQSPLEMRDLIDEVNSPYLGCYFDVGNVLYCGYPQDWIDILGRRVTRIHIKDFKLDRGGFDGFVALGEGDVNFPAVWAALKRAGYDSFLTTEISGPIDENYQRLSEVMSRD